MLKKTLLFKTSIMKELNLTDLLSDLKKNVVLKSRSSFNEIILKKDKIRLQIF